MLRKVRIALAAVFFAGVTLLLLGIGQDWWGWMAKMQFIPAVWRLVGGFAVGNLLLVLGLLLLTFLVGRIYCSVICPLGIFQDVVIWLRRRIGLGINKLNVRRAREAASTGAKGEAPKLKPIVKHFKFSPERKGPRYAILTAVTASAIAVGQLLLALIGPYSTYGRAVRAIAGGSLTPAFLIFSLVMIVAVAVSAWLWGRAWCNVICPVGSLLGLVSRYSVFKIRIDESKCTKCGRCVRGCKSSCIDMDTHSIDHSRCIDCFDCLGRCKEGAISFVNRSSMTPPGLPAAPSRGAAGAVSNPANQSSDTTPEQTPSRGAAGAVSNPANQSSDTTPEQAPSRGAAGAVSETSAGGTETAVPSENHIHPRPCKGEGKDKGRRGFLKMVGVMATGAVAAEVKAQEKKVDGGLAPLLDKVEPDREGHLVPPGALSAKNFEERCIGCQLCVGACPNGVLRPGKSILDMFQPQMGYDSGWCRPECTACSQACPAGAITPVDRDEKTEIRIGVAVVNPELCLAAKGEALCGNCNRHCPNGAIMMIKDKETGHRRPVVNEQDCIGCGACEFLCPVRPLSAITVKALGTHAKKM